MDDLIDGNDLMAQDNRVPGSGQPVPAAMSEETLHEVARMAEALVFASASPVSVRVLAERLPEGADIAAVMEHLRALYSTRGVNLVKAGDSWAFRTAGDLSWLMSREAVEEKKLWRAALEVLSTIA